MRLEANRVAQRTFQKSVGLKKSVDIDFYGQIFLIIPTGAQKQFTVNSLDSHVI
jgi:hypothetical protein